MLSKPNLGTLERQAPAKMWHAAEKQALRSPHKRHRTGCVIYNSISEGILRGGTAHTHNGGLAVRSVHAEADALTHIGNTVAPLHAVIVTLTQAGNYASTSKPCLGCCKLLAGRVAWVVFAERDNAGGWNVMRLTPKELLRGQLSLTRYFR